MTPATNNVLTRQHKPIPQDSNTHAPDQITGRTSAPGSLVAKQPSEFIYMQVLKNISTLNGQVHLNEGVLSMSKASLD